VISVLAHLRKKFADLGINHTKFVDLGFSDGHTTEIEAFAIAE
jgi:hypothetical protein